MSNRTLLDRLREIVGDAQVLSDPEVRAQFETDWTGRFSGTALAVVRPGTTEEVSRLLSACSEAGVPVVPQGGNTGLVGGSVPRGGEILLSTTRLKTLGPPDPATLQIEAGAGVTLARLQAEAATAGLSAGLDLGARDSATLGGLIACDAGGPRAMRHGTARARVAGLEAVLADGSVIRKMSGLLKDNAGYDLTGLFAGSEGTLGVVTAVRWKLEPVPSMRVAALVGLASLEHAARLVTSIRPKLESMEACEFFTQEGLALVSSYLGSSSPFENSFGAYLLIECAGDHDPLEEMAAVLEGIPPTDILIGDSSAERERLWRFREAHTEAISAVGIPHKLDVGVPLARLAEFASRLSDLITEIEPEARVILFGHLGDGNVHVNVLGLDSDDDRADGAVLELAAGCGGTISAEHGVGIAKARWLSLCRSEEEIAAMRAIKRALDPSGLMNPGAVIAE